MTSVTSPQQTDRRGTGDIPGPRGGQGVRLLVLGADPDAQELRDQAAAAGYELAQRYSARVSHVAYGAGIDPDDPRYTKIRAAGLSLLPLQKCAEELGLGVEGEVAAEAEATAPDEAADAAEAEAVDVADVADVSDAADAGPEVEAEPEVEVFEAETSAEATGAGLAADAEPAERDSTEAEARGSADVDFAEPDWLADSAEDFVPGFSTDTSSTAAHDLPIGAAVIGADPWTGGEDGAAGGEVVEAGPVSVRVATPVTASAAGSRSAARRMLVSVVWALIPFATFGLLTPVTFGYAAYRLRSRGLVASALGYTVAVIASFVLSAARPHSATPSDASGALLTLALAATWLGGTLHAVSIRTRVFAR